MLKNFLMSAYLLSIGLSAVAMDETPSLEDKATQVHQGRITDYPYENRDAEHPHQNLKCADDQGDASAQSNLALMYHHGEGVEMNLEEAVRLYTLAVKQGDGLAQNNLAGMYLHGEGVEMNLEEAAHLYTLAVKHGHASAQNNLASMYENGQGVKIDLKEAARLYTLAAEQGNANAQCKLGVMYEEGQCIQKDLREAFRLYTLAAKQGNANAQIFLASMYKYGTFVALDLKEAARLYKLAADQGFPAAQNNLASMYLYGEGVEMNLEKAARLFKLAAKHGHASAQTNLASMYENGQGVKIDLKEAARLYTLAAEQGNATAQASLAYMYEEGKGVEKDLKEAARLHTLAAEQGDTEAQAALAFMYLYGEGVKLDLKEAARLYTLAAEQGNATAQVSLAHMYEEGEGVEKDLKEAVRLCTLAAEQGDTDAQAALARIYQKNEDITKNLKHLKAIPPENGGFNKQEANKHFDLFEMQFTKKLKFKGKYSLSGQEIEGAAKELSLAAELGNGSAKKQLKDFKKLKGYKDALNGKADSKSTDPKYRLSVKLYELEFPDASINKQATLQGKADNKPSALKGSSQKSTPTITLSPSKQTAPEIQEMKLSPDKGKVTKRATPTTPQLLSSKKNASATNASPDISQKTRAKSQQTAKHDTTTSTTTTTSTSILQEKQTAIGKENHLAKELTIAQQPSASNVKDKILPKLLADTPSLSGKFSEANNLSESQLSIEKPSKYSTLFLPLDEKNIDIKDGNGKEKTSKTLSHKKHVLKVPLTRRNSETQLTSPPKASEKDSGVSLKRQEPRKGLIRTQSLTNVLPVKDNQKTGNKEEQSYEKGKSQHHSNKKGFFNHLTSLKDKDKNFEKKPSKIDEIIAITAKDDSSSKSKGDGSRSRKSSTSFESQDSPVKIYKKLRRTSSRTLLSCSEESSIENEISENSLIKLNILPEKAENYYPRHNKKLYRILNQKFDLNSENQETLWVILTGEGALFQITLNDIEKLFLKFNGFTKFTKQGGNHKVVRGMALTLNPNADGVKEGAYWGLIKQAKEKIINIIAKTLTKEDDVGPQEDKSLPHQTPLTNKSDVFTEEKK